MQEIFVCNQCIFYTENVEDSLWFTLERILGNFDNDSTQTSQTSVQEGNMFERQQNDTSFWIVLYCEEIAISKQKNKMQ